MKSHARRHWNSTSYRTTWGFIVMLVLGACSGATGPSAGDPSILVTNDLPSSWVYVTWKDGQGIVGRDSVAPRTVGQCVRFTAQPDSAYWEAVATENGATTIVRSPTWFNPSDRPAWSLDVTEGLGAVNVPAMRQADAQTPC
jgi:hypothetical protein